MSSRSVSPASPEIDAYLARVPEPARATLQALRAAIRRVVPAAEETISYGIPAFRLGGVVAGFAATPDHCALYLFSGSVTAKLAGPLSTYDVSKGTVRFPRDRPLPGALLQKLLRARLAELGARAVTAGAARRGGRGASGRARRG